jgi:UDP-2,3-diacylglucosamine hydrolase
VFRNPLSKFLFGLIPPFFGISLAEYFSKSSRASTGENDEKFLGEENEWLIQYCKEKLKEHSYDYFVFGHRHLPIDFQLNEKSRYINLGDWIKYDSYAVLDGTSLQLKFN